MTPEKITRLLVTLSLSSLTEFERVALFACDHELGVDAPTLATILEIDILPARQVLRDICKAGLVHKRKTIYRLQPFGQVCIREFMAGKCHPDLRGRKQAAKKRREKIPPLPPKIPPLPGV